MQPGKALDDVAALVADGTAIDWPALALAATTQDERAELECLCIVDALARAHRSDDWRQDGPRIQPAGQAPDPGGQTASGERTWGRFHLRQEVGAGSFGSVHRAWDPDLERELAIKILHRHVGDPNLRSRILREGRALARVRDTHVVSVLGVETVGDEVGLCMEFVEGDTLEGLLRTHGTLNAGEAALLGQDLCQALSAVHLAGFVHRDVKPRNVMRDRTGRIVLMDFGTGQDLHGLIAGDAARIAGTPHYMAPEVLAGRPATVSSDIYSVGVLLYYLVSRAYPVEGRSLDEITSAHILGQRTPLGERRPDLPAPFRQIVDRAVAGRPEDRWPSASALFDALGRPGSNADVDRHPIARGAAIAAGAVIGLALTLTGLGAISSKFFNTFVLGRENFVNESVFEWMYWGALSLTAPLVLFLLATMGMSLLLVVGRLVLGASASARRLDDAARALASRLQFDEVPTASGLALVTASAALLAAWWVTLPTLSMLIGLYPDTVSTASVDKLAFLTPPHQFREHEAYRVWFTWSTIVSGAVWVPVMRLASRRHQRVSRLMLLGGAAVFVLSAALLDLPFRAFSQNELETAEWNGQPCYVLGEREHDLLVLCPDLPPPRSAPVAKNAAGLRRLGVKQNVFTRFGSFP